MSFTGYLFLALVLAFTFLNGFQTSSNIVATIIFSRAMSPRMALTLTALAEFCGPFIFGVAVAKTIGAGIVAPEQVTIQILLAALGSAIVWNLLTWFLSIPSSPSHALVGGIVGAVGVGIGLQSIQMSGLWVVLAGLFFSPAVGFAVGFLVTHLIYFLARNASLKINWFFKRGQILTGVMLALSHGSNDGQKSMGILALGMVTTGTLARFEIPIWIVAACAGALALGTAVGGWRLIRTLGGRFYKIRPVHGFSSQVSSAAVILGAALLGGPVSTTQVVSSAILGVGAAERMSKVRWGVAGNIAVTWVVTIPANALLAALLYGLIRLF